MSKTMKLFGLVIGTCLLASVIVAELQPGEDDEMSSQEYRDLMGTDATKTADSTEFATKFTATTLDDARRTEIMENLSPFELVALMKNAGLTPAHKAEALRIYGLRFDSRHILIQHEDDTAVALFKNEISFNDMDAFKDYATVVATKTKSLVLDFNVIAFKEIILGADGKPVDNLEDATRPHITAKMQQLKDTKLPENIEKIELRRVFGNEYGFLDVLKFPKVVELSLVKSFLYYYAADNYKNKISYDPKNCFPNVRRLAIARTEFSDFNWIKSHYKLLTHLIADVSNNEYFNETEILNAVKANDQLIELGIFGVTPKIMREIGKGYPKILTIGVKGYHSDFTKYPETITMNNIERFYYEEVKSTTGGVQQENKKILKFPKLEELYYSTEKPENLIGFLKNHKEKLKKLTIEKTVLTDAHLKQIIDMKKLEEVTIIFDIDSTKPIPMTGEGIAAFIALCPELTLLRLVTKNVNFKNLVDQKMQTVPEWEEFLGNPLDPRPKLDDTQAIYVKKSKIVLKEADKFAFFKNYFYIDDTKN